MGRKSKLGIPISQYEDKNAYQRAWRALNPDKQKEYDARKKEAQPWIKHRYGITKEDRDAMLVAQDYKCKICHTDKAGGHHNTFHIDHCHSTNKVRGLLCDKCNRGLGYFNDTPTTLRKAADYLDENS